MGATRRPDAPLDYPPLVWVAAPAIIRHARLGADGHTLVAGDGAIPYEPAPKIPLNRSYFDASSIAFLSTRAVTVRGTPTSARFVARTFWPDDFTLGGRAPPMRALPLADTPAASMRALMRELPRGGAQSPYAATTLWQRDPAHADWAGTTGDRAHGQRRARRRRRSARRSLRAGHRTHRRRRRHRRLARQQLLLARRRKRERHPGRAGAARQLSRRSEQRPGLVSAVVPGGCGIARHARADPRAVGAEPRLQPVLPAPAHVLPSERQLHEHQRRYVARARLADSRARTLRPPACVARISASSR